MSTAAARFVAQWFPIFLLDGLFGKLIQGNGSLRAIALYSTTQFASKRTMLSVVIASAPGATNRICLLSPPGRRQSTGGSANRRAGSRT